MRTRAPALRARAVAVVVALVLAGCGSPATDRREDLTGTTVDVLAVWADTEQQRFERVLDGFEELTGATVRYISTEGEDITTVLDGRLATGAVPDVAILPQPGLLRRYAAQGKIWPVDATVTEAVRARYADVWRRLASVDGRLYGVWFKAAHKSLIWYNVGAFERGGAVPPSDLDGLLGVMPSLRASGVAPLAVAGADPWTLTDWFENLYLQLAGPARYDALAEHRLPWTDPSVVRTLELLGRLLTAAAAGASGDAETPAAMVTFVESVRAVFSGRPAAAMVFEGDFVPGAAPDAGMEIGLDVDVFPFPGAESSSQLVVGGGDVAVLMRPSAGGRALLRFLATPEAAEIWVRLGGFVSANEDVDLTAYPDATTRTIARTLLESADDFRFDLSDNQPADFGATSGAGMFGFFADFLVDPSDPEATAARLEAAATEAYARR